LWSHFPQRVPNCDPHHGLICLVVFLHKRPNSGTCFANHMNHLFDEWSDPCTLGQVPGDLGTFLARLNFNRVSSGENNTFHGHLVQHQPVIQGMTGALLSRFLPFATHHMRGRVEVLSRVLRTSLHAPENMRAIQCQPIRMHDIELVFAHLSHCCNS